ncbi:MAG: ABC transporter ATP-binding protein [Alphaproteobacteria bacterium]|nr:ABC transporter ATP-binding protein [Alphaproteobacteria bacterium]
MLKVSGLSASYGAIRALENVSIEVEEGQVACLLGANGAGKTTVLNCISGVVQPTGGTIEFVGNDITGAAADVVVAKGVVQVPEGREIFSHMTVKDNLELGAYLRRDRNGIAADLRHVFEHFSVLEERQRQMAGTLSGGEQQMLMIGRALMAKPKLLLLDEPSLGLSPILIENLFAIIDRVHDEGMSILLVEQNASVALAHSTFGYILENGEIRLSGPSTDLVNDPAVREAYLGG